MNFEYYCKKWVLNVYQGKRAVSSGHKKGALFIPFYDDTYSDETYGGGCYLVLDLPDNDELILVLIWPTTLIVHITEIIHALSQPRKIICRL